MSFLKWPDDSKTRPSRQHHRRSWSMGKRNLDGMRRVSIISVSESQLPRPARYDGSYSNRVSRRGSKSEGNPTFEGDRPVSEAGFSLDRSSILEVKWTAGSLLELSDSVRLSLAEKKHFGPWADRLTTFLRVALAGETRGNPMVKFETIKEARLDKLLHDISEVAKRPSALSTTDLGTIADAMSLQRMWRTRLKVQYFTIDERRAHELVTCGRLKDVAFTAPDSLEGPILCVWKPSQIGAMSDLETDLQFDAGRWWLNIACACRDGIAGNEYEKPTKRQYGTTALPLLTGREEVLAGTRVKYIREGKLLDMHNSLVTQTGKQIRILRGYRLKSIYAPSAGVRYDGLWRIVSYRQKLDDETNIYRLELTIERAEGSVSMDAIMKIPRPSQLDDWQLYEKLETEKIRKTRGESEVLGWRLHREEDKLDRVQWQRARAFTSSISTDQTLANMKLGSLSMGLPGSTEKTATRDGKKAQIGTGWKQMDKSEHKP